MNSSVDILVFDLGGVLVDWDGINPLVKLSNGKLDSEQARLFWMNTPWIAKLDTGACTPEAFSAAMADSLGLDMDAAEMTAQLDSWLQGAFPAPMKCWASWPNGTGWRCSATIMRCTGTRSNASSACCTTSSACSPPI